MYQSNPYPRTGIERLLEAETMSRQRARLSSMPQLRLALENDSEAAGKTATSLAPAATAASKPWKKWGQMIITTHKL
jgi:chloramphenicol 3-O-phosphotransferase